MGLVTIGEALLAADRALRGRSVSAKTILTESARTTASSFDIFLSHSKMDEKYVLGAKKILEEKGFTVYVDWIEDPQLDRSSVNKRTARHLRTRMRQCSLMFYLHTKNASLSKWCPWELGFFDSHSNGERVFVFPLVFTGEGFSGQEYLELYPLVDIDNVGKMVSRGTDVWAHFPDATASEGRWKLMSNVLAGR